MGLCGLFEDMITAVAAGASKPDKRIFQLLQDRAGVPAHEIAVVGDNFEKDIMGANAFGMHSIWVPRAVKRDAAITDLATWWAQGTTPEQLAAKRKLANLTLEGGVADLMPEHVAALKPKSGWGVTTKSG